MKQLLIITLLAITYTTNAQLGIGTTNPNASAQVDLTSTTKGFLPPRMTAAQRDLIGSAATGLIIYCTNCGSSGEPEYYNGTNWVNMAGGVARAATQNVAIGDAAFGGIIAYILVYGDPGYNANVQHGLVAATADQSAGIQWWNGSNTAAGASRTAIGTGLANTNSIITSQGATSTDYAAGIARAYAGGGYTDWFLPSKDELNKLWINRVAVGSFSLISYYWSSSENGNDHAWFQYFGNDGTQTEYNKGDLRTVRAVRAF